MSLADLRLDSPEVVANPYPLYADLREHHPAFWYAPMRCWLISRAEDVRSLLKDSRVSAGGRRYTKGMDIFPEAVRARFSPLASLLGKMMLFHDPPEHTRLRRHLNSPFTKAQVATLRASIQSAANRLIDGFPMRCADVIPDFARPLPADVICELLAVPVDMRMELVSCSDDLADFFVAAPPSIEQLELAQASTLKMAAYFKERLTAADGHNPASIISLLVGFGGDTARLSPDEIAAQCILLMFGGQETVRNTIGTGCWVLLRHPDQLDRLRSEPDLWPQAIGEILRWQSPVQFVARVATEAISLHGQQIAAGDPLLLLLGSANRDPLIYADAEDFSVGRKESHSAFGHGSHKCIGEWLARLESEIALQTIFNRLPTLRLCDSEPAWINHLALRGLTTLPVAWE